MKEVIGDIMPQNKKTIINVSMLITLIIITFLIIFKDYNFTNTINIMLKAKPLYIILAVSAMLTCLLLQSINVKANLALLGNIVTIPKMLKYTFTEFFFSGITPGGSGGQPMEIYYMKKEGIPVTSSTLALLIELCSYHIITMILGIIGLYLNHDLLINGFIWIFIVGLVLKMVILTIMIICLFSKRISQILVSLVIKVLKIFKYSKVEEVSKNLNESLNIYNDGSNFIKEHKIVFLRSLFIVALRIITYYSVTYFVYLSFGLNTYSYIDIISIQALLLVTVSSIPLPGSVGISENVFLNINEKIFTMQYLPSGLLLCRGISFYLFMFIALIIVIINIVYLKKKNKITG